MCWFQVAHKTVDEDIGSFIIYIQTSDASSVESSCVISTVPITATAGMRLLYIFGHVMLFVESREMQCWDMKSPPRT